MKKQYIIQAMTFNECGKVRTQFVKSHTKGLNERITRTRWIESARGFETYDEAMEYAKNLSHDFFRLDFVVVNRSLVVA